MQTISITIGSDKKPYYTSVPLVEGESNTTFVTATAPTDWAGLDLYALVTTPGRVKVDQFLVGDGFYLTNTMLDTNGTLSIEFVGTKSGTVEEVARTCAAVKIGVAPARTRTGTTSPEALPDLLTEVEAAVTSASSAATTANEAAASAAEIDAQARAAEAAREAAENARNVFAPYNAATAYVVGNKVTYLGSSYRCILASTGNLPTNGTYWMLIASKGDKGDTGEVTTAQLNAALALKADKAQEAWITPTLAGLWTQQDATNEPVGYFKDSLGFVHLRGAVKGGAGYSTIFTLPIGYRPSKGIRYVAQSQNGTTPAISLGAISASGLVFPYTVGTAWTSLDGICFRAEA